MCQRCGQGMLGKVAGRTSAASQGRRRAPSQGCEKGTVEPTSKVVSVAAGWPSSATHRSATSCGRAAQAGVHVCSLAAGPPPPLPPQVVCVCVEGLGGGRVDETTMLNRVTSRRPRLSVAGPKNGAPLNAGAGREGWGTQPTMTSARRGRVGQPLSHA